MIEGRKLGSVPICPVECPDDPLVPTVRELFQSYEREIGVDLCFQRFGEELAHIPGGYGPPTGLLLVAKHNDVPVGCGGLRKLDSDVCEMKRLYVAPESRSLGIGRLLVGQLLAHASRLGYRAMRLDTLKQMSQARRIYQQFGFVEIAGYYDNPLDDVIYMECSLE